jgi:alcohol dehydrogenase
VKQPRGREHELAEAPLLEALRNFDYRPRTDIVFGIDTVERTGRLALETGARRALLVTDSGIVAAGHAARVRLSIEEAGLQVVVFDRVQENPSTQCVEKCVEVARAAGIDLLVGLGGGSSMDTAKGCNFLLTNGGRMQDYQGVGKARSPMLPLIAIPTTGGTGSECQSFALITDPETHQKMACGDPKAAARVAILDPALTVSQPARVTACSGIDAVAHAVETAVTRRRTPISTLFSREAFRLTTAGLPRVIATPGDLEARGWMLLGAAFAGIAIENSMLGAAHSAANPLTARFGIVHGQAVGVMLPHIVQFNSADPAAAQEYSDLAHAAQLDAALGNRPSGEEKVAETLRRLLSITGLKTCLEDLGVKSHDLHGLAREAAKQWTAQFNPRPVAASDFEELYKGALR